MRAAYVVSAIRGTLAGCLLVSMVACSSSSPEGGAATGGQSVAGAGTGGASTGTGGAAIAVTGSGGRSDGTGGATASGGGFVDAGVPDAGAASGSGGSAGTSSSGGRAGGSDASAADARTPDASVGAGADARIGGGDAAVPTGKFTVYLAGDSTVSQYVLDPADPRSWAGWGQMLQPHYDSQVVTVLDKAVGGMTARHFILGGNLAAILNVIKAGDYLLVQFGTNDSNMTTSFTINGTSYPYFAAPSTDFKTYLQQYIDGARAKNAIPVLVTPPPRNSAYCMWPARSLADYGQAMIELGAAQKVAVVDLGLKTFTYLNKICPKPASAATETFFKVTGGTIDGTHFQENGARIMAGFVADGVGEAGLGLDAFRLD